MQPPISSLPAGDSDLLRLVQRASSAGRTLRRLLADHAAAADLSDAELLMLWLCGEGHGMVQGELAAAIGVSPALMSGMVERLRQRSLLEMQRSLVDRRRQVWRTTEAGRQLLADLRPVLVRLAGQLSERFSSADQQTLENLCDRLLTAANSISLATPIAQPATERRAA
jgi:MarR family 2-MHQ and catechol resistance regulon transcriptional repressor